MDSQFLNVYGHSVWMLDGLPDSIVAFAALLKQLQRAFLQIFTSQCCYFLILEVCMQGTTFCFKGHA